MKKLEREIIKKLEKERQEMYKSYLNGQISLEVFKEKLKVLSETIGLMENQSKSLIFLDKREIRELAGKTLYISLPKNIMEFGWDKGTEVKLSIEKEGQKIILEKLE